MTDDTTIRVRKSTWRCLHERKDCGDTMDDVVQALLEEASESKDLNNITHG